MITYTKVDIKNWSLFLESKGEGKKSLERWTFQWAPYAYCRSSYREKIKIIRLQLVTWKILFHFIL